MSGRIGRPTADRADAGAVAILVAILIPVLFVLTALALDVGRWYLEASRLQSAADAAAMAGVTSLQDDAGFDRASQIAVDVAAQNGYPISATTSVVPFTTARKSELGVSVTSVVGNTFGAIFGRPPTQITRTAVADYQGAAIMGSPCNYFGNQPSSNTKAAEAINASAGGNAAALATGDVIPTEAEGGYPTCQTPPPIWGMIEGPAENKQQGDRYATMDCQGGDCDVPNDGTTGSNKEHDPNNYFWVVRVEDNAVGTPISMQIYDPAYVAAGQQCDNLTSFSSSTWDSNEFFDNMNPFAPDAEVRYDNALGQYCTGDNDPGGAGSDLLNTSFALFMPTPSQDPLRAQIQLGTNGQPCTAQFRGFDSAPQPDDLRRQNRSGFFPNYTFTNNDDYNVGLTQVFHQWVQLCEFTPLQPGDYYLQVRSNMALPNSTYGQTNTNAAGESFDPVIYRGNPVLEEADAAPTDTSQNGSNSYALRAYVADVTRAPSVAVAGWEKMAIFANSENEEATFNLIQVLSNAAGKSFEFSYFDGGDGDCGGTCTGTIQIIYPIGAQLNGVAIANGTPPESCSQLGPSGTHDTEIPLTDCTSDFNNSQNNGRLVSINVDIPSGYTCEYTNLGSCWFRVVYEFDDEDDVMHDATTWDALINGDSIRIVR